ncbi:MAG: hypothetical protein R8L07_14750 [Alphaproteobacteria bacterium]|nr:hypothetical protein [Alphaproteobacteria bacterium]
MLLAAACAGPTNEQFAAVAQSGITFTTQIPSVYRYQIEREINEESALFEQSRAGVVGSPSALSAMRDSLEKQNAIFLKRRLVLAELSAQSKALRKYFVALNALALGAEGDAAAKAAADAAQGVQGLVNRAKGLEVGGKEIQINGIDISQIISGVSSLGIDQLRNAKLRENLEKYGNNVLALIAVQREALKEINKTNVETAQEDALATSVAEFGDASSALPANWGENRIKSLLYEAPANPVSSALASAIALEDAVRALARNDATSLDQLENAVALTSAIFEVLDI